MPLKAAASSSYSWVKQQAVAILDCKAVGCFYLCKIMLSDRHCIGNAFE